MTTKEFSIDINRPLSDVYAFAADPAKLPEWGEGIVGVRLISEEPVVVGSTFAVKNSASRDDMEFINVVTAYEPHHLFAFRTEGRMLTYTATRTFAENEDGTTVTETITVEPPRNLFILLHPFVSRYAIGMHQTSLQNLKRVLES